MSLMKSWIKPCVSTVVGQFELTHYRFHTQGPSNE